MIADAHFFLGFFAGIVFCLFLGYTARNDSQLAIEELELRVKIKRLEKELNE